MMERQETDEARRHALEARAAKKAAAVSVGVDEDYIASFVDRFYAKVQTDDLLGPIFDARIDDWPAHLTKMKGFWRSILHNSGEFSGSPMRKHIAIPGIDAGHFSHWLELFYATLREEAPTNEATRAVGEKARMIADSLLTGIEMHHHGLARAEAGRELPYV